MSKHRLKIPALVVRTREEMQILAGEIAGLKTHEALCAAQMDAELKDVRDRYTLVFAGLQEQIADKMAMARAWAEAHPGEFGEARSLDLTHAVIGYRTGQPQLKTVTGWTWDRVLERLKTLPGCVSLVRLKEEVNKQQILAEREQLGAERLRQMGLRVAQEETFFVEPRLSEVDRRESISAAA